MRSFSPTCCFDFHSLRLRAARMATVFATLLTLALTGNATAESEGAMPDYKIGPEDILEVSVWKEPDLQRQVVVRPDGGISFPLVGNVQAVGKSPVELEQAIKAKLDEYIPNAVVTVSVIEIRGLRIYVAGKVSRPGQYVVGRYIDVLQAITLAGGLTPFADESGIQIIRRSGDTEQIFRFNYAKVKRGRDLNQNIILQADDTVVVP